MRKQIEPVPDHLRDLGYEPRDVSLPILTRWLGVLFFFLGGSSLVALLIYTLFVPYHPERDVTSFPERSARRLPPEPRVQADPIQDMIEFRAKEEQALRSYAWTDKSRGRVRIPVELAIQKMAAQLPVGAGGSGQ